MVRRQSRKAAGSFPHLGVLAVVDEKRAGADHADGLFRCIKPDVVKELHDIPFIRRLTDVILPALANICANACQP